MSVPLPADTDGMIGRECPSETCTPRYFKIQANTPIPEEDDNEDTSIAQVAAAEDDEAVALVRLLHCPYCGRADSPQAFATPAQIEYAKSVALRTFIKSLHQELQQLERQPDPHAMISFGVTVTPGALPTLATYQEERLKQSVLCPECSRVYAVYGVSFDCPYCGASTILEHVTASRQTIHAIVHLPAVALDALDVHARDLWLSSAAGQVVSLWEGYLKAIYRRSITDGKTPEEATRLENSIGTTFQRIEGAVRRFHDDLGLDLLAPLAQDERETLSLFFSKRHVFTHNLGVADPRYQAQTQSGQVGQEIEVTPEEIDQALALVDRVLTLVAHEARPHNDPSTTTVRSNELPEN